MAAGILVFDALLVRETGAQMFQRPLAAVVGLVGPYVILVGILLYNRFKRQRLVGRRALFAAKLQQLGEGGGR